MRQGNGNFFFASRCRRAVAPSRSLLLLLTTLTIIGCQTPRAGNPLAKELAGSEPETQLEFWHALTDEPIASNDQAFHALLLYLESQEDLADYPARVEALQRRNMLPAKFDEPADAGVKRGTVAVAIIRILNQRGGITLRLFGPTPRYAVRELMFLNVLPPSTPNQTLSGNELVGIIGRLEDYQRGNPADVPAAVLPGEMK